MAQAQKDASRLRLKRYASHPHVYLYVFCWLGDGLRPNRINGLVPNAKDLGIVDSWNFKVRQNHL